ncbi:nucleotide-diphosphate-sugar epimerase [Actinorhabdospora filicis]|uniref:Nucleotide-diphosphate-sugar epimerase n=1 Tax=Actinorhabdospora filicis TaxID=1785913 RepID=A0A9W6SJ77_9ACTN|nr:NmrA family NAD(P)-binding protein [Actinorhabdospora filicis]GLZ76554.1 nucleotide-diphosphate-sugar epimerase [Actinorhabdospora filicis]
MQPFLITGATGRVGSLVAASLAALGHDVRGLARSTRAVLPPGVTPARGDLADPASLAGALEGVGTVFLVWPGLPVDPRVIELIAAHAGKVVYLSADVTDLAEGEEPVFFHQEVERLIRGTGLEWTFVRAITFAANTLAWAAQAREGVVRLPYGSATRAPLHERDIAEVSVRVLTEPGHHGGKYLITGPETLSHAEQARVIGEAAGRPVRWEEQPEDEALAALTALLGDAAFARQRLAAWRRLTESPDRVTSTVADLLGRPALSFAQWAADHAEAFR